MTLDVTSGRLHLRVGTALVWAGAAVGVMSVASAITPSIASRSEFVRGVLPPGVPSVARVLALAFGIAAERDLDLRDQLAALVVEAVRVRRREGYAEGKAPRDDRDLANPIRSRRGPPPDESL